MTQLKSVRSILVVDDDQGLRKLMETWLRMAGYDVTTASERAEIVGLLQTRPFDLVVTDMLMPDIEGTEVIMAVKKYQPEAATLAISGGGISLSPDVCGAIARGLGAGVPLMKPFVKSQFLTAVGRAMMSPGDSAQLQKSV